MLCIPFADTSQTAIRAAVFTVQRRTVKPLLTYGARLFGIVLSQLSLPATRYLDTYWRRFAESSTDAPDGTMVI